MDDPERRSNEGESHSLMPEMEKLVPGFQRVEFFFGGSSFKTNAPVCNS